MVTTAEEQVVDELKRIADALTSIAINETTTLQTLRSISDKLGDIARILATRS